jgi:hypothetical protein
MGLNATNKLTVNMPLFTIEQMLLCEVWSSNQRVSSTNAV